MIGLLTDRVRIIRRMGEATWVPNITMARVRRLSTTSTKFAVLVSFGDDLQVGDMIEHRGVEMLVGSSNDPDGRRNYIVAIAEETRH